MNDVANELKEILQRLERLEREVFKNQTWHLPERLWLPEEKRAVLDRALVRGMMEVRPDGRLHWTGGNDTTLAFLCGRLWCGDRVVRGRWRRGSGSFPASMLCQYFDVKCLRQKREQGLSTDLTDEQSMVYELFRQ